MALLVKWLESLLAWLKPEPDEIDDTDYKALYDSKSSEVLWLDERLREKEREIIDLKLQTGELTLVQDAEYWNNRYIQTSLYYSAPTRKKLTTYLKRKEDPKLIALANKIIKEYGLSKDDVDAIPLAVMRWNLSQNILYASGEKPDHWLTAYETLHAINQGIAVDCEDMTFLTYGIIEEILRIFGLWESHKHRLVVKDRNMFQPSSSYVWIYAGRHVHAEWLAEDKEWYTVEGIGSPDRTEVYRAKNLWLLRPTRLERSYGLVNALWNDEYIWLPIENDE